MENKLNNNKILQKQYENKNVQNIEQNIYDYVNEMERLYK